MLARTEMAQVLARWQQAWNDHDLEGVLALFHEDVVFENWTGARVIGRRLLRRAWRPWFADPGGFRFIERDLIIDEAAQKALLRWRLEWPSQEPGYEGRLEAREGVDLLYFRDGKISHKLTYSKTAVEIAGRSVALVSSRSPASF